MQTLCNDPLAVKFLVEGCGLNWLGSHSMLVFADIQFEDEAKRLDAIVAENIEEAVVFAEGTAATKH